MLNDRLIIGALAFNFPLFEKVSPTLALATLIGNVIFGLVTAFALKVLSDKRKLHTD